MEKAKRILKAIFVRRVRVAIYSGVSAADVALVASGDLPAWTLVAVPSFLLAILNLSPDDVPKDDQP